MPRYEPAPAEFEGRLSKGKDWREIVAWVGDLPPMPHVASRAVNMVENPLTNAKDLAELLSTDTALAARVLKIANSAMFCRQREITTLNQAIMVIGLKALKGIVVAATLRQMNKSLSTLQKLIWENSMCTAMCSMAVAKHLRRPFVDEIFLLGLLHSLGQIVLLAQPELARDYKRVLKLIKEQSLDYVAAEQQVFGFAHPLIGALVAKKWNFSADTCQVILHYKDPLESLSTEVEQEEKTLIVQMADLICHAGRIGSPEGYPVNTEMIKALALKLNFPQEDCEAEIQRITEEAMHQFQDEQHVYG